MSNHVEKTFTNLTGKKVHRYKRSAQSESRCYHKTMRFSPHFVTLNVLFCRIDSICIFYLNFYFNTHRCSTVKTFLPIIAFQVVVRSSLFSDCCLPMFVFALLSNPGWGFWGQAKPVVIREIGSGVSLWFLFYTELLKNTRGSRCLLQTHYTQSHNQRFSIDKQKEVLSGQSLAPKDASVSNISWSNEKGARVFDPGSGFHLPLQIS